MILLYAYVLLLLLAGPVAVFFGGAIGLAVGQVWEQRNG